MAASESQEKIVNKHNFIWQKFHRKNKLEEERFDVGVNTDIDDNSQDSNLMKMN